MEKLKNFINKHKFAIISLIIIMIVAILYCLSKRSFHVDESLSFALSNHPTGWITYEPFGWFEKDFFSNYAVTDSPFNYARVYNNQYWDVHPPLYYYLLHSICSFFPYRFTIWFGLIINLFSFLISAILIYAIAYKLLKNDKLASIAILLFGLNKYVLDCLIFIRMYMLSAMFVLFFIYFAINIVLDKNKKLSYFGLLLSTICGGLTHYHYYFIIASISLFISIYLITKKRFIDLLISFVAVAIGIILNLFLFFPATFAHLNSGHANAAKDYFNHLGIRFDWLIDYINISVGMILFITTLIITVFLLYLVIKKKTNIQINISFILFISFFLSFILITQSTNILASRYIIPSISLVIIGIIVALPNIINGNYKNYVIYIILFAILVSNLSFKQITENINTTKSWDFAEEHQYGVAVFITDDDIHDYQINELFADLRWYMATGITQIGKEFDNSIEDNFVLYIQKDLNQEEAIDYILSELPDYNSVDIKLQNINKNLFNVYEVIID